jgi:ATP-binding cassette subfamily B protein
MGFFSSLDIEKYDRQYSDRQLIKRMADYFLAHLARLVIVSIFIIIISGTGAISPIIVSKGVDLLGTQTTNIIILTIFGLILLAGIINWGANWVRRRLMVRTIGDIELTLRSDAFEAAVDHDLSFFDEISSGKIVSRITSDTKDFGQIVVLITDVISQFIQALILGIILIQVNWKLSLYLFGFLPVLFLVAFSYRHLARTVTRQGMRAMANVNSAIKETVSGIAIAKNFRKEAYIYEEFKHANIQSYEVNIRRGFVLSIIFPTLNALGGIGTAILVYTGGLNVIQGVVTAGIWFLFIQSLDRFFNPILNLSAFWAQIQNGLSAAERIFAIIDAETTVIQTEHTPVSTLQGEIFFDQVDFRYTALEKVLEKFSLHIKPGENIALVGHTGAGKSSIAKLIARYYEFQGGKILIDGEDIRTFNLKDYRHSLGIVPQVPFLFSDSVAENIRYARPKDVSLDEIREIAYKIGNGEWLENLPNGLETDVGERGILLSMGQRQLVSLMRVLVQKPSIFILDEATASIDPFTEKQIQQALNMILSDTTSILIAHRLSTVKAADRIIVLDEGEIIEEGNHESLLSDEGHYARLYNTYFRHQSLDYVEQSRKFIQENDVR